MTIRHVRTGTMRPVDDPAPCAECARLTAEITRLRAFVVAWDVFDQEHDETKRRWPYQALCAARAALDEAAPESEDDHA